MERLLDQMAPVMSVIMEGLNGKKTKKQAVSDLSDNQMTMLQAVSRE